jgi:hypothetical protein
VEAANHPKAEAKTISSSNSQSKGSEEEDEERGGGGGGHGAKAESKSASSTLAVSEDDEGAFQIGCEVEVFGLQSRPELNDRRGVIVERVSDILYTVLLYPLKGESAGAEYRVKLRNLKSTDKKSLMNEKEMEKMRKEAREVAVARAKEEEANTAPIMMFCQPIPLETLIQQVLNIGDYKTFSIIMRMKVFEVLGDWWLSFFIFFFEMKYWKLRCD